MRYKKTILRILNRADKLLNSKQDWTKHTLARDQQGDKCSPHNNDATCWCIVGAIKRSLPGNNTLPASKYLEELLGIKFLGTWNDHPDRTFQEIKGLLRRARRNIQAQIRREKNK